LPLALSLVDGSQAMTISLYTRAHRSSRTEEQRRSMSDSSPITTENPTMAQGAVGHSIAQPQHAPAWSDLEDELEAMAEDLEGLVDHRKALLRRVFDWTVASIALLILAPVMLLVALVVRLDSPGPVFYTQDRIGINRRRGERRGNSRTDDSRRTIVQAGKAFRIWKFRTMRQDAEAGGPQWAQAGDPRITRVGRFLRKTRLDEVPQFFNVIRGDMTLIGPRPERSFFIKMLESEIPHYSKRLLVKPGITGFAQVNNGYDDSVESVRRKVVWDLRYIRRQGMTTDCKILLKTVRTVLTGDGAC
jgi:lipopolysaccharide/colanic/teichoic acid biosynthesis glycosyltransferase